MTIQQQKKALDKKIKVLESQKKAIVTRISRLQNQLHTAAKSRDALDITIGNLYDSWFRLLV